MEFTKVASWINLESLTSEQQAGLKLIDELIAKLKSVGQAEIKLSGATTNKDAAKAMKDLAREQSALTQTTKAYEKSLLDAAKAEKISAAASKDNANAKKLEAQAANEAAKAALNEAKAETENSKQKILAAKYIDELDKAKRKLQGATNNELKNQEKLTNAYEQLKAKYAIAANTAKRLGAEQLNVAAALGITSKEYLEAAESTTQAQQAAQKYYLELVKVEDAVGQSQRKVGQYTNATFALSQILREAPAFAFNFQTGLLGISNNIPILVDEIQRLNKVTGSAFKSFTILAKSLFSISNIITIAVSALTLFGPKLFAAGAASDKLNESQKELLETEKQLNDVFKERISTQPTGIDNFVRDAQKRIDLIEKEGTTQARLFDERIKAAKDEAFFANDILRVTIARAESEDSNKEKQLKGIDAIRAARADYDIQIANSLIYQQTILNDIVELEKAGKGTKQRKKDLELVTKQLSNAKAGFEVYNKAIDDADKAQTKFNNLVAEQTKFNSDERRKLILQTITQEVDLTQKTNGLVLANDRSTLKERLDALKNNLAAQQALIAANRDNVLTDPTSSDADRKIATNKANNEAYAAQLEFQDAIFKLKEDFRLRDLDAQKKGYVDQLTLSASVNKELSTNIDLSLKERLKAQEDFNEQTRQAAEAEYRFRLQQAGLSDDEIVRFRQNNAYKVKSKKITDEELLELAREFENENLQLVIDSNTAVTAILEQELSKQRALREKGQQDLAHLFDTFNIDRTNQYSQDVIDLNKSLKDKTISYKSYLAERAKLDRDYSRSQVRTTIEFLEDQLAGFKNLDEEESAARKKVAGLRTDFTKAATDEDRQAIAERISLAEKELAAVGDDIQKKIDLQRKLAEAKKQFSDDSTDYELKNREKIREAEKKFVEEAISAFEAFGSGVYERQKNQVQDLIDKLEVRREKEIEVANQTSASAQDAANEIIRINARVDAQKKQLEARQRQIEVERAKFARAVEIGRIIGQTAVGVVNALSGPPPAPPNPFLAAIIGATGALQLAHVIATPIPHYATGLEESKQDHWGITGDGGRSEYVRYPDGSGWITPDKPTLTFLPKGSSVVSSLKEVADEADLVYKIMAHANTSTTDTPHNDLSAFTSTITREMKLTRRAIMNKREHHWKFQNNQISLTTRDGYNETTYLNQNLGF